MAGKYKAYPEYKDSGLLGIDAIPADWAIQRIKFLFEIGRGRVISQEELDEDALYPVYSSQTQNDGCLGYINTYDFDCEQITWTTDGANAGTVFLRNGKHNCTNVCGTLQPKDEPLGMKFFLYCLEYVCQFHKRPDTNGAKIMNNEMAEISVTLPSIFERTQITNFLDHETTKIDTLNEEQQSLIRLLQEKRQAVISHAVTKGLNPDAPMKDSGVEWLGQVPEHWKPMQLRRIIQEMEQGKSPECESREAEAEEWGGLKTSCVNNGLFSYRENKALPKHISPFPQYEVNIGDILMFRASGSIDLIGSVAYVTETKAKILLSDKIFRLHLSDTVDKIYFAYLMQSSYMRKRIEQAISGAEGMANNITKSAVMGFTFALPPLSEQAQIVDHISKHIRLFNTLIDEAKETVSLSQERRTALISAAVTGKIDVRDWVAPAHPFARDTGASMHGAAPEQKQQSAEAVV